MSDFDDRVPAMNRRQFLGSLLALGASVALPVPVAQATDEQISEAWTRLQKEPWHFEVNESGTIVDPAFAEPLTRREVFRVSTDRIDTPQELIQEVDGCYPLCSQLRALTADVVEEIRNRLDSEELDHRTRGRLKRLEVVFGDADAGWKAWVRHEGKRGLPRLLAAVEEWLAEAIDWDESEWFPHGWGDQGHALAFFELLDRETLVALDVKIVLGEHPGSTYYAAELPDSIAEANAVAEMLGLPFRFRQAI